MVGVQAQDVRAAGLALRSRVPGLERSDVDHPDAGLVRTWTVRGTVHLVAEEDRAWLHAVTAARNGAYFERLLAKRGGLEVARGMLGDAVALLAQEPLSRAELLARLAARGHADLGPYAVNVFVPWAASQGVVVGLADGRLRAARTPDAVDGDEALATLARRYLAGYGPATAHDLASWSGQPLGVARRALAMLGDLEAAGDLVALPGTFDAPSPVVARAQLLAAFDTTMLGHRTREPFVAARHDGRILPGGGMLRPVVLARGQAAGTWRLEGSGPRRVLSVDWFGRAAAAAALAAEARDVARFLGVSLTARAAVGGER